MRGARRPKLHVADGPGGHGDDEQDLTHAVLALSVAESDLHTRSRVNGPLSLGALHVNESYP